MSASTTTDEDSLAIGTGLVEERQTFGPVRDLLGVVGALVVPDRAVVVVTSGMADADTPIGLDHDLLAVGTTVGCVRFEAHHRVDLTKGAVLGNAEFASPLEGLDDVACDELVVDLWVRLEVVWGTHHRVQANGVKAEFGMKTLNDG